MESFAHIEEETVDLAEPHFDDELTVVTAQPVVPLATIAKAQTRKRRFLLAGAFALSLLLGAGTALLAIRLKRNTVAPATFDTAEQVQADQPQSSPAEIQGGETPAVATQLEDSEDSDDLEEDSDAAHPVVTKASHNRPAKQAQRVASKPQPVKKVQPVVEEEPRARLVDEWQERRARRVMRRERHERRQRQDLFRVGEIFEGPRRPANH